MIDQDVVQGSPEWLAMRVGAVTASRVADVMAKLKRGGESAARVDYRAELVCERLTGTAYDHYVSPAMQWGIENEQLAKAAYEIETGAEINYGGIATHDRIRWLLASPDGLVGEDGLIECKAPNTATHIGYVTAGVVPEDYHWQMLTQMACTGREWCDFVSYDPRLPKRLQLFVRRFPRDEARIKEMEVQVEKFLAEVEQQIESLKKCTMVDFQADRSSEESVPY